MFGKQDIRNIAKLSALEFSEQELDTFSEDFSEILDDISVLNNCDMPENQNKSAALPCSALREDKALSFPNTEGLLKNAPKTRDNYIVTKQVIK